MWLQLSGSGPRVFLFAFGVPQEHLVLTGDGRSQPCKGPVSSCHLCSCALCLGCHAVEDAMCSCFTLASHCASCMSHSCSAPFSSPHLGAPLLYPGCSPLLSTLGASLLCLPWVLPFCVYPECSPPVFTLSVLLPSPRCSPPLSTLGAYRMELLVVFTHRRGLGNLSAFLCFSQICSFSFLQS